MMKMNLPNKLTLLRIMMIPLFVIAFYLPFQWNWIVAFVIFLLAYITDYFDGKIARKRNQITTFGKFMDPIADKLLTLAALIMLQWTGVVSPIVCILVLGREFIVSGVRLVVASDGTVIAASWLGKAKTMSQFISLQLALALPALLSLGDWTMTVVQVLIWISVLLALWSGWDYVYQYRDSIFKME